MSWKSDRHATAADDLSSYVVAFFYFFFYLSVSRLPRTMSKLSMVKVNAVLKLLSGCRTCWARFSSVMDKGRWSAARGCEDLTTFCFVEIGNWLEDGQSLEKGVESYFCFEIWDLEVWGNLKMYFWKYPSLRQAPPNLANVNILDSILNFPGNATIIE